MRHSATTALSTAAFLVVIAAVGFVGFRLADASENRPAPTDSGVVMCEWVRDAQQRKVSYLTWPITQGQASATKARFRDSKFKGLKTAGIRWVDTFVYVHQANMLPAKQKDLDLAAAEVQKACAATGVQITKVS